MVGGGLGVVGGGHGGLGVVGGGRCWVLVVFCVVRWCEVVAGGGSGVRWLVVIGSGGRW